MKVGAKIIQRITRNTASDVVHSSGLAGMGASTQRRGQMSFEERQAIAQNRKIIQGYKNSRIARDIGGMPSVRSYGRTSGEPERRGYGRTEGDGADKRCRYGRTSSEEMEKRYGFGRKSDEDVRKERMEQHSEKKSGLRGSGGGMMAIGGSGSVSGQRSQNGAQPSGMKKYYDFRPDLGFGTKNNDPTANF